MICSKSATVLVAFSAAAAMSPACSAASLPACPITNGQIANYDIIRAGSVIGHQTTRYVIAGPDLTVTTDVAAALRVLGIRVYHYQHHGEEFWHDGQMVHLVTTTDDDGTPRHVDATRDPKTGVWSGITGPQPGPAPLMTTSLWNIQTVQQTRLLDREKGTIVSVHADAPTTQTIQIGTRQITASKYDLTGPVSGAVWYDTNGCWVQALYHTLIDGSLIEVQAHQ